MAVERGLGPPKRPAFCTLRFAILSVSAAQGRHRFAISDVGLLDYQISMPLIRFMFHAFLSPSKDSVQHADLGLAAF